MAKSISDGLHIDRNGTRYWYKNGLLHREDGPAVEWPNGTREWWLNGELHREGGPAIVRPDGSKEWWHQGHQKQGECSDMA